MNENDPRILAKQSIMIFILSPEIIGTSFTEV